MKKTALLSGVILLILAFVYCGSGSKAGDAASDTDDAAEIPADAQDAVPDQMPDVPQDQGKDGIKDVYEAATDSDISPDACIQKCENKMCGPDGCGGTCGKCPDKKVCAGGKCVDNYHALTGSWVQFMIGDCILEDHWFSFYENGKAVHTILDLNMCSEHGVYIFEGDYSIDEAGDLNFSIDYGNGLSTSRKWTYAILNNAKPIYFDSSLLLNGKSLNWKAYTKDKEPFSWRRIQEDASIKQGSDGYSLKQKLDLKVRLDKEPVVGSDCKMTLEWDALNAYNTESGKTDKGSIELSCSVKESSVPGVISIKWKDFSYWIDVLSSTGFYQKCAEGMCALVEEAFQSEFLYLKNNPDILYHDSSFAWYSGVNNEPPEALPVCGNSVCEYGESEWDCQLDCCQPDCNGKQCGDDGCGGVCGTCQAGCSCVSGLCAGECTVACGDNVCNQWEDEKTCPQDCKYSIDLFLMGMVCKIADWNPQITEFIVSFEWKTSVPAKCHLLFQLNALDNPGEVWFEEDLAVLHKYDMSFSYFYFYGIKETDKIYFQMKCWDKDNNPALSDIKFIVIDKAIIKCLSPGNEKCGDGSYVLCRIMPPVCDEDKVLAAFEGCYRCVYEKTCTCDDGLEPVCPSPVPTCPGGTLLAKQKQCYLCVSPVTCSPPE
jgi:hypothetical protein